MSATDKKTNVFMCVVNTAGGKFEIIHLRRSRKRLTPRLILLLSKVVF